MESETPAVLLSNLEASRSQNDADGVLGVLKTLTSRTRDDAFRAELAAHGMGSLADTFKRFAGDVLAREANAIELCTECVRCLRNACAQCHENQDAVAQSEIIEIFSQLVRFAVDDRDAQQTLVVLLRCCIQCLNNIASGHPGGQLLVWDHILKPSSRSIFSLRDEKSTQYTCMLLQTCLTNPDCLASFAESPDAAWTVEYILSACSDETDHDFALQFIQMLLRSTRGVSEVYDKLTISSQTTLLHIACAAVESEHPQSDDAQWMSISKETLLCFAEQFKDLGHHIMSLAMKDSSNEFPNLVMSIIDLLCAVSAHSNLQSSVQEMDFLLETCLELLEMMEEVGRSSQNAFTVDQDLERLSRGSAGAEEEEPGYGLKRNLVQLIGNLCFRHRGNQDKVRELHGIPVILQQCNIDSKNAFINQWAILAVHNLCEDNPENQAVIASLKNQGVTDNESLGRLGFEAVMRDDGQVYLKNIKKK